MTTAAVVASATAVIASAQERDQLFTAWLRGTANGGPEGDGRYPLPSPTGTVLVPCMAALVDPLTGAAQAAEQSAAEAGEAHTKSQQEASKAAAAKSAVSDIKAEVVQLLSQANDRYLDAAAAHAAARAEREKCEQLKSDVQALYDEWSAAQE